MSSYEDHGFYGIRYNDVINSRLLLISLGPITPERPLKSLYKDFVDRYRGDLYDYIQDLERDMHNVVFVIGDGDAGLEMTAIILPPDITLDSVEFKEVLTQHYGPRMSYIVEG